MDATHLFESGTASQSCSPATSPTILRQSPPTNDHHHRHLISTPSGMLYGSAQNNATRKLSRFLNVECRLADSRVEIPRLLDALPPDARAVVFVDGPKGIADRNLALSRALRHPRVEIVALHDTAPFWDARVHVGLRGHADGASSRAPARGTHTNFDDVAKREWFCRLVLAIWPIVRIGRKSVLQRVGGCGPCVVLPRKRM